jgi:hypothetical protein
MQEILSKLNPQKFPKVLQAYIQTWQLAGNTTENQTPLISILLPSGQVLFGEIVHIQFETQQISLRILQNSSGLDVAFIDFSSIQNFILHELEKCPIFVNELGKL